MSEVSKPHSEPEHTTHFHDAAARARELLDFEGEPKVIGQWFAEARYMARAYLGLVEQLEAKQRELDEEIERAVENGRLAKRLHEQVEALRTAERTCLANFDSVSAAYLRTKEQLETAHAATEDTALAANLFREQRDRLQEQYQALERAAAVLVAQPFGQLDQRAFYALRELLSNPAKERS